MKKKILSLICVALLATGCLCSCGEKREEEKVEEKNPVVSEVEDETEDKKEEVKEEVNQEVKEEEKEESKEDDKKDPVLALMNEKTATLGDLEKAGLEYGGYVGFNGEYEFTYTSETTKYAVKVDFPQNASDAMHELSIFDDDYYEKQSAILSPLLVLDIEITSGDIVPDEELAKYVGRPASVLINDGFEVVGYMGAGDTYSFYFAKDGQQYSVILDDSVATIMDMADDYKTEVLPCIVENIEYYKLY